VVEGFLTRRGRKDFLEGGWKREKERRREERAEEGGNKGAGSPLSPLIDS
jgi:hypothetical protein